MMNRTRADVASAWLSPVAVAVLTFTAMMPTLGNGFVNWDDDASLLNNPYYRGFGTGQLRWMLTTFHMGHYTPLSWLSFALDFALWGENPRGYHLTSLILHAATAVLAYFIILRLFRYSEPGAPATWKVRVCAAAAALLFAAHPLRVESVAWATARGDTLSGFLCAASVLAYLRAHPTSGASPMRRGWLAVSVVAFGMALLAKATVAMLPLVLLIVDVYPLKRLYREDRRPPSRTSLIRMFAEKTPYWVLSLGLGIVAQRARIAHIPLTNFEQYGALARLSVTLRSLVHYVAKTLVPAGLSPLSRLIPDDFGLLHVQALFGVLGTVIAAVILWRIRARWPAVVACFAAYAALAAPLTWLVLSGPEVVPDRYSYLAAMPLSILVGAALWALVRSRPKTGAWAAVATAAWLGSLMALTWRQTEHWRDSESLWRRSLAINEESYFAQNGLGYAFAQQVRWPEAVVHYQRAIELRPDFAQAHNNLGAALRALGKPAEAVEHFRLALKTAPGDWQARYNLADTLMSLGRGDEALPEFARALQIKQDLAPAAFQMGLLSASKGDMEKACAYFTKAVELDPNMAEARNNLAVLLSGLGRHDEAITQFKATLDLQPDNVSALYGLGAALRATGRYSEAIAAWRRALELAPEDADILMAAAWTLATCPAEADRNGQEAARLAQRVCAATDWSDARALDCLAAAFAAAGLFDEAQETARMAGDRAAEDGNAPLVEAIAQRLRLYEAGKSYVETTPDG